MKYLKPLAIGLFLLLFDILMFVSGVQWLFVYIAVLFSKWDDEPTPDSMGQYPTIRGDLPGWAWWLATPNERLPGGTYEPTVLEWLKAWGPFWCSWYWLAVRNRQQGLAAWFSVPTSMPWDPTKVYQERGSLWFLRYPILGRWQAKLGWRTYQIGGEWRAVPCVTITVA